MAIGAISLNTPIPSYQAVQQAPTVGKGWGDDESTESKAVKAREASREASNGNSLPVDTNRGRNLNISV